MTRIMAALLVMLNLPLALVGGIAAVWIMQGGDVVANTAALLGLSGDGATWVTPVLSIASLVIPSILISLGVGLIFNQLGFKSLNTKSM